MLISGIQDAGSEAYRFRIRVFHVIPKDVILKEKRECHTWTRMNPKCRSQY